MTAAASRQSLADQAGNASVTGTLIACFAAFLAALGCSSIVWADQRPNIVMAFADDWGKHAGAYAKLDPGGWNDYVTTPHFDRVAREGVLFTNAYVSAPSCTPCRSSLLSGQHFWRCGRAAILSGAVWDGSIPTYPLMLESAGYRIGHTYKVWSPGRPIDAPYGGRERGYNSHGRRFNQFSQNAMKNDDHAAGIRELLDEVRQNIRSFLDADDDGRVDGDAPFCYWFGPTNCHRKWTAGSGKELWGIDPADLQGKLPPYLPDVPIVRQDVADYFGEIQAFDAGLGVLIDELKRLDVYDNTILVVSGDHGMPGVTRGKCDLYDLGTQVPLAIRFPQAMSSVGRVVDDFVSLPDLAPTFLEVAGVDRPESMIARSLVNVIQSDQAGSVDPRRDAVFTGRERHVGTVREGNRPYPMRAIRTDRYLYIINFEPDRWPMGEGPKVDQGEPMPAFEKLRENTFVAFGDLDASPSKAWIVTNRQQYPEMFQLAVGRRPGFELYDVQQDPHFMQNLADDPAHEQTRRQLHLRLMQELTSTGDPRVSDDVIFERSPWTDDPRRRR